MHVYAVGAHTYTHNTVYSQIKSYLIWGIYAMCTVAKARPERPVILVILFLYRFIFAAKT